MTSSVRLRVVGLMLLVSAVYAVLVVQSPVFAHVAAVGYIVVILTAFVAVNLWRKP